MIAYSGNKYSAKNEMKNRARGQKRQMGAEWDCTFYFADTDEASSAV